MLKVIISEGKTTNEAIENGLKELNTTRNNVEIKILEQEKRSFFDILAPRVVKVELTLKEEHENEVNKEHAKPEISNEELYKIKEKIDIFIK